MNNDGQSYDLAAIRELLLAAFTPQTLRRFCQDCRTFQPIVAELGPGHGLTDMVDRVIDYCATQLLWHELLVAIENANPRQYEKFEPKLHASLVAPPTPENRLPIPRPKAERTGSNPFVYGTIVPPDRFHGRSEQIVNVKHRIGADIPQSVSIVGFRGSGKSSLLHYIEERIAEFCPPEQNPIVVSIDLKDSAFHTELGIWQGLRYGIYEASGEEPWKAEEDGNRFRVRAGLKALRASRHRLIILFDHFDSIEHRLSEFRGWAEDLRAKATDGLFCIVVASRRTLSDLFGIIGLTSPLDDVLSTSFHV